MLYFILNFIALFSFFRFSILILTSAQKYIRILLNILYFTSHQIFKIKGSEILQIIFIFRYLFSKLN